MLTIIILTYCGIIWLIFFKFKLLPWNAKSRGASILVGVAMLLSILILLAQGSPQSTGGIGVTTRTVSLQAYSRGRVLKVHVASYEPMKAGDPIVTVDPVPYQNTVRQLEASLAGAIQGVKQMAASLEGAKADVGVVQANIAAASSGIEAAKANVDTAEASVGSAREFVTSAKADVARNASNVKTGELQLTRIRDLVAKNVSPQAALDEAENKLVAAHEALKAAKSNEARAEEGTHGAAAALRAAQAYEEQARRNQGSLRAQLLVARAAEHKAQVQLDSTIDGEHTSVRQVRDQLATARYDLEHTVIRAPDTGFVAALAVTEGDVLMIGQFGTFVLTGQTFAIATFSQTTVRHIKPGQKAEIAFASRPGEIFEAEVVAVIWASGEAQLSRSANLPMVDQLRPPQSVGVRFKLKAVEGFDPQMGVSGTVAVYTDHGEAFAIIRKVTLRIETLLNYFG